MHKIFSLIIYRIFTPILPSVILTEGVAGSLDGDPLGLNESKPAANHSVSSAGHETNNILEESISDLIFERDSHPYNLTYANWTEKWWQWAYSIPLDKNPSYGDSSI